MPSPVLTFTDTTSAALTQIQLGNVNASSTSAPFTFLVWNNKGGTQTLSSATTTTITALTYNGLSTGDTIPNGQEVVSNLAVGIQCTSQGDTGYTQIGGSTSAPIGSASGGTGTILGTIGGDNAVVNLTVTAASNIVAGPVQFLIRCSYVYS
jgi:hypothetical protein